jgi:hypothetical protein
MRSVVLRAVGANFFVRENLFQALRHLRDETTKVTLWNDAICINQNDDKEKERQIAMMSDIYNSAYQVSIWLGDTSEKSDMAMDFIREVVQLDMHQELFRRDDSPHKWDALFELMRSRWFSRRWVIQELALARSAIVYCGKKMVHWNDFSDAVSIFRDKLGDVQAGFRETPRHFKLDKDKLNVIEAMGASVLVNALTDLLRKSEDGAVVERALGLDYLVSTLVSFDVTDPRDTIYALLAIARDNPQNQLKPSQKKNLLEVYTEFIKHCVVTSKSLDMICRHWAPARATLPPAANKPLQKLKMQKTILPSWVRQLDDSAFGTPEKIFRGRRNADSLVGDPRRPNYSASGHIRAEAIFGTKSLLRTEEQGTRASLTETFDGSLTVKGLALGEIISLSPRIISGIIPQEALQMSGWGYSLKEDDLPTDKLPDRLWRTLVAGRGLDGQRPPGWYKRACLYSLQREDNSGDIHIRDLIDADGSPEQMVQYLKRVQNVVWNRKIFKAGENGELFGLASRKVEIGDLVCILHGCSVPVVLRKHYNAPQVHPDITEPASPTDDMSASQDLKLPMSRRPQSSRKNSATSLTRPKTGTRRKSTTNSNSVLSQGTASVTQPPSGPSTSTQISTNGEPEISVTTHDKVDIDTEGNVHAVALGPPELCYKLVGTCYVDGLMDGEALSLGKETQSFKLV